MRNIIKIKKVVFAVLIASILFLTSSIYAANDSFKTALSVNKSQLKRGEEVTVTLKLSDISIESGEKGIGAYSAKIDFDSNIFEYVSISGSEKWDTPLYQDKLITATTSDGNVVNTNQSIATVTLKVKSNATLGDTTIKLTNFSGSTAASNVSAPDSSVKITIEDTQNQSGER